MASNTVNIAEYLYIRLTQLGCKSLHGLPGDFNLLALDFVKSSGLRWVGNCNELNAGYAADAYARVTGLGAIMTTFGVGELSAVNAIAGAYAELAPVVHIVGTPPREAQDKHLFLHHTLGNGDYHIYSRIYKEITIAQAELLDPVTAPNEIDRVLRTCVVESRPVYIQLPTDMVTKPVSAALLTQHISTEPNSGDARAVNLAIEQILERVYAANKPAILVDGAVERRRVQKDVEVLIRKLGFPVFVAPMGKGAVDETLPNFVGVYAGVGTDSAVKDWFEQSDMVITIGNIQSDLNTTGFSTRFPSNTVAFHYTYCLIGESKVEDAPFKSLIPQLTQAVDNSRLSAHAQWISQMPSQHLPPAKKSSEDTLITHAWLWPRLTSWFRQGDVIVLDTGTSYVGYWSTGLPKGVQIINQLLWSSIGYGVGAVQGAGLAAQEAGKGQRTICFEGDGSFQLTAQELSTIIRHDLNVTIFLIENDGYTIERFVHGLEASYNDVMQWKYHKLPHIFAQDAAKKHIKTWRLSAKAELEQLLNDNSFAQGKGLQFVEIHMPKLDAPQVLIDFGRNAAKRAS